LLHLVGRRRGLRQFMTHCVEIPAGVGVDFSPELAQLVPAHHAVKKAAVVTVEFAGIGHGRLAGEPEGSLTWLAYLAT